MTVPETVTFPAKFSGLYTKIFTPHDHVPPVRIISAVPATRPVFANNPAVDQVSDVDLLGSKLPVTVVEPVQVKLEVSVTATPTLTLFHIIPLVFNVHNSNSVKVEPVVVTVPDVYFNVPLPKYTIPDTVEFPLKVNEA